MGSWFSTLLFPTACELAAYLTKLTFSTCNRLGAEKTLIIVLDDESMSTAEVTGGSEAGEMS